ncbi:MAG: hypothetical protein JSV26_08210 [bacterium]|nr:MAG: hypothetical protein JSV26_08210 [bacterium]
MRTDSENRHRGALTVPFLILAALTVTGCAGAFEPPPPLWEPGRYSTIAVLPSRMEISTGAPFTSKNTELSDRYGALVQEAIAVAMVNKGYEVLAPMDSNERIAEDDDLMEAFMELAFGAGVAPPEAYRDRRYEGPLETAPVLGEALGADLIVLSAGEGEYHSAGEALVQGILTSVLTKGKQQYQAPPSYLVTEVVFVDPELERVVARLRTGRYDYVSDVPRAAGVFLRLFRRIPPGTRDRDAAPPPPPP